MRTKTMLVIVLAVALFGFARASVIAAEKPADTVIGFVDIQKVFYECETAKAGTQALQTEGDQYQKQLERMLSRRLLAEEQRKEADTLDTFDKPTDAQKKRLDELSAEAKKYEEELKALQQVTSPDDAQKVRLNELTSRGLQASSKIEGLQQDYAAKLSEKNKKLSATIQDKIKAAIADVGKSKNLTTIVDKQVILYGGLDLTEEVLKIVNKK